MTMQAEPLQAVMAELKAAAAIQAEASSQYLLFDWGKMVVERLRGVWEQIETLDTLAYEDKVAAQVRTLEEATSSLWHLHHSLVVTRRRLKRHQQQLQLHQRLARKRRRQAPSWPTTDSTMSEAAPDPLAGESYKHR
jgi:hypothetical protein